MVNTNTQNQNKDTILYDYISMSHNDSDGISCQIVLKQHYQNLKMYNCSYDKIIEYLDHIDDNCYEFRPREVYITDLSFETPYAIHLKNIVERHPDVKFIYVDHHPYPDDLMAIFKEINTNENFVFVHSVKASATKLTYKYLDKKYNIKTPDLELFVERINAYDIWLEDSEHFKAGFMLNELFWTYKLKQFYFQFVDSQKIQEKHKERYKQIVQDKTKYFQGLKDKNLLMSDENKLYIFADEYKSWITIDYPEYDIFIIASTYSRISVRIGKKYTDEQSKEIKHNIIDNIDMSGIISLGGHDRAFGVTLEPIISISDLIKQVEKLHVLLSKF